MDSDRDTQTSLCVSCLIRIRKDLGLDAAPLARFVGLHVLLRPDAPRHSPRARHSFFFSVQFTRASEHSAKLNIYRLNRIQFFKYFSLFVPPRSWRLHNMPQIKRVVNTFFHEFCKLTKIGVFSIEKGRASGLYLLKRGVSSRTPGGLWYLEEWHWDRAWQLEESH